MNSMALIVIHVINSHILIRMIGIYDKLLSIMVVGMMYLIASYMLLAHASSKTSHTTYHVNKHVNVGHRNPSPIYYLSTNEGLISHYRQLEILWNFADLVNRSIIAVGFYSHHYHHIQVNLCDIFILPDKVSCSKADNNTIIHEKSCVFTGILGSSKQYYGVTLKIDKNISLYKQECIAGFITQAIGHPTIQQRMKLLEYPFFTEKYRYYLPTIYHILGLSSTSPYIIAHWRRGDQVTKCTDDLNIDGKPLKVKRKRSRIDNSVNCANVSVFYDRFHADMMTYIPNHPHHNLTIYVSTNERNATILDEIKSHGIILFDRIRLGLASYGNKLNELDEFVLEMMMMCDATYMFAWGDSSSHNFFYYCRMLDHIKKHVTIMDDPQSIGHGYHVNHFTS